MLWSGCMIAMSRGFSGDEEEVYEILNQDIQYRHGSHPSYWSVDELKGDLGWEEKE